MTVNNELLWVQYIVVQYTVVQYIVVQYIVVLLVQRLPAGAAQQHAV